jgi:hypothetical protein
LWCPDSAGSVDVFILLLEGLIAEKDRRFLWSVWRVWFIIIISIQIQFSFTGVSLPRDIWIKGSGPIDRIAGAYLIPWRIQGRLRDCILSGLLLEILVVESQLLPGLVLHGFVLLVNGVIKIVKQQVVVLLFLLRYMLDWICSRQHVEIKVWIIWLADWSLMQGIDVVVLVPRLQVAGGDSIYFILESGVLNH